MQLVLQHCYKTSWKAMFLLLILRFKPVNNPGIGKFLLIFHSIQFTTGSSETHCETPACRSSKETLSLLLIATSCHAFTDQIVRHLLISQLSRMVNKLIYSRLLWFDFSWFVTSRLTLSTSVYETVSVCLCRRKWNNYALLEYWPRPIFTHFILQLAGLQNVIRICFDDPAFFSCFDFDFGQFSFR